MARPRTASNVLELRGSNRKNPGRARERENEPEPNGELGDPPAHLTEGEQICWREIASLAHIGTLCKADRIAVEMASRLLAQIRNTPCIDPAVYLRLEIQLGKFGMTPADRSKVSVPKKGAGNPFADL